MCAALHAVKNPATFLMQINPVFNQKLLQVSMYYLTSQLQGFNAPGGVLTYFCDIYKLYFFSEHQVASQTWKSFAFFTLYYLLGFFLGLFFCFLPKYGKITLKFLKNFGTL